MFHGVWRRELVPITFWVTKSSLHAEAFFDLCVISYFCITVQDNRVCYSCSFPITKDFPCCKNNYTHNWSGFNFIFYAIIAVFVSGFALAFQIRLFTQVGGHVLSSLLPFGDQAKISFCWSFSLTNKIPFCALVLPSLPSSPPLSSLFSLLSVFKLVFLAFSLFLSPLPSPLSVSVFSLLGLLLLPFPSCLPFHKKRTTLFSL